MLIKINKNLEKLMPLIIPLSVMTGVLSQNIVNQLFFLVPWLFAFMTFIGSLTMKFRDIKVIVNHPLIILFSICFLHILMPIWAYILSQTFFNDYLLTIGFVISAATPAGITSIVWLNVCRANFPLGLSVILIDTLLAPAILPILLFIVADQSVDIDNISIIWDLIWMILLPSVIGILVNKFMKNKTSKISTNLSPFSKISLFAIIVINSSAVAPYIMEASWEFLTIIITVVFIVASGYGFALILAHLFFKDTQITKTLTLIGGTRNITIGIIIAISYFPEKVAMPVVFCILFQQILASLFAKILGKYQRKYN